MTQNKDETKPRHPLPLCDPPPPPSWRRHPVKRYRYWLATRRRHRALAEQLTETSKETGKDGNQNHM